MVFCISCGASISDSDRICPHCSVDQPLEEFEALVEDSNTPIVNVGTNVNTNVNVTVNVQQPPLPLVLTTNNISNLPPPTLPNPNRGIKLLPALPPPVRSTPGTSAIRGPNPNLNSNTNPNPISSSNPATSPRSNQILPPSNPNSNSNPNTNPNPSSNPATSPRSNGRTPQALVLPPLPAPPQNPNRSQILLNPNNPPPIKLPRDPCSSQPVVRRNNVPPIINTSSPIPIPNSSSNPTSPTEINSQEPLAKPPRDLQASSSQSVIRRRINPTPTSNPTPVTPSPPPVPTAINPSSSEPVPEPPSLQPPQYQEKQVPFAKPLRTEIKSIQLRSLAATLALLSNNPQGSVPNFNIPIPDLNSPPSTSSSSPSSSTPASTAAPKPAGPPPRPNPTPDVSSPSSNPPPRPTQPPNIHGPSSNPPPRPAPALDISSPPSNPPPRPTPTPDISSPPFNPPPRPTPALDISSPPSNPPPRPTPALDISSPPSNPPPRPTPTPEVSSPPSNLPSVPPYKSSNSVIRRPEPPPASSAALNPSAVVVQTNRSIVPPPGSQYSNPTPTPSALAVARTIPVMRKPEAANKPSSSRLFPVRIKPEALPSSSLPSNPPSLPPTAPPPATNSDVSSPPSNPPSVPPKSSNSVIRRPEHPLHPSNNSIVKRPEPALPSNNFSNTPPVYLPPVPYKPAPKQLPAPPPTYSSSPPSSSSNNFDNSYNNYDNNHYDGDSYGYDSSASNHSNEAAPKDSVISVNNNTINIQMPSVPSIKDAVTSMVPSPVVSKTAAAASKTYNKLKQLDTPNAPGHWNTPLPDPVKPEPSSNEPPPPPSKVVATANSAVTTLATAGGAGNRFAQMQLDRIVNNIDLPNVIPTPVAENTEKALVFVNKAPTLATDQFLDFTHIQNIEDRRTERAEYEARRAAEKAKQKEIDKKLEQGEAAYMAKRRRRAAGLEGQSVYIVDYNALPKFDVDVGKTVAVRVVSCIEHIKGKKKWTMYETEVKWEDVGWTVFRKYGQWWELDQRIKKYTKIRIKCELPEKEYIPKGKEEKSEKEKWRVFGLNEWAQELMAKQQDLFKDKEATKLLQRFFAPIQLGDKKQKGIKLPFTIETS